MSYKSGFTIPELLVAIFVFSLVIGGAANLLLSGIGAQRQSLAYQELIDQNSFLFEYMSRGIRQAQKDLGPTCLIASGRNYEVFDSSGTWIVEGSGDRLRFLNNSGQCQEFFVESNRVKERIGAAEQFLTSDDLVVNDFKFVLLGAGQDDDQQPRVTFLLYIQKQGAEGASQPSLRLQTSVSQRTVDVPKSNN